jgi:NhaA family Na+:H+ antiporter
MPLQVLNRLLVSPFQRFVRAESAGGIVLIVGVLTAFAWANSPWAASYAALQEAPLVLRLEDWQLEMSLLHWVNDGLMAIFFLLVGLEIKRELITGELLHLPLEWGLIVSSVREKDKAPHVEGPF